MAWNANKHLYQVRLRSTECPLNQGGQLFFCGPHCALGQKVMKIDYRGPDVGRGPYADSSSTRLSSQSSGPRYELAINPDWSNPNSKK